MAKKTAADASPVAHFETSLDELEQLVGRMEQGELSLEESLAAYERGVGLYRSCRTALEQAELRVRLLSDPDRPETAEPFAPCPMASEATFARWAQRVEASLGAALPDPTHTPQRLHAAMRHATLGGGKRMRPLLVYAAGTLAGADDAVLDAPATAVELIHAYSLVHDDLPAMDDDALRRGRPTVHVAFDEATAILAGDALQTLAFEVLAGSDAGAVLRVAWLQTLARASGVAGMCGGQALDIDATGQQQSVEALQRMHALKTGALIRASVRLGALAGGVDDDTLQRLDAFADALGLAFQVRDDILDVEASSEALGKTAGKDAAQAKSTYPALLGMDGAKARLAELDAQMRTLLAPFGARAESLAALGELAVRRGTLIFRNTYRRP